MPQNLIMKKETPRLKGREVLQRTIGNGNDLDDIGIGIGVVRMGMQVSPLMITGIGIDTVRDGKRERRNLLAIEVVVMGDIESIEAGIRLANPDVMKIKIMEMGRERRGNRETEEEYTSFGFFYLHRKCNVIVIFNKDFWCRNEFQGYSCFSCIMMCSFCFWFYQSIDG